MSRTKTQLSPELQAQFAALCRQMGRSQAQLLRQLVAEAVAGHATPPAAAPVPREPGQVKVTIRLTEAESAALTRHAKALGMTRPQWLLSLLRAKVFQAPQLSHAEVEAVHAANRELRAIGRNLNQVARALNAGDPAGADQARRLELETLAQAIDEQTRRVSALCDQALNRWTP